MTEDKKVGWHHQLNGHEFEQVLGVGDGQGGPVCCRPWGRKESDATERLNSSFLRLDVCFLSHVSFWLSFLQIANFSAPFTLPFPSRIPELVHLTLYQRSLNHHHFQKFFYLLCVQLG